jgi:hypothetical protein
LLYLELKGEKMQMKQRALDCGEGPAYGPIPRDAKIWRAQKTE